MKRQRRESSKSVAAPRALGARSLREARGGDLGITVEVSPPPPPYMSQQHNEALIRLSSLAGGIP